MSATLRLIKAYNTLYSYNNAERPYALPNFRNDGTPVNTPIIKRWTFPGQFGADVAPGPPDSFNIDLNKDDTEAPNADSIRAFVSMPDAGVLENCIGYHWYELMYNIKGANVPAADKFPPYHLIFAYLIEHSRIFVIFERLIMKFKTGEDLGHPSAFTREWIRNTEDLFYKDVHIPQFRSVVTALAPSFDATRRNAYYRLFGLELGHGSQANTPVSFVKPTHANLNFVALLEHFLREVWQGVINHKNTSGVNTTDIIFISELALQLKDSLLSRRNADKNLEFYESSSLSKEEFLSVIMAEWYYQVIATNTELVRELNAEAVTPYERLAKLGKLVGVTPHSKTHDIFELAPLLAILLRMVEEGKFDIAANIQGLFDPSAPGNTFAQQISLIINLWQKTTGSNLKQMPNTALQNGAPKNRTIALT
ncbi:hypothetical protein HMJ29_03590 [Hymenobacter taeanensis]|uniref:Uncharacterized protein n=1 Tax=Hymenobacter taeanensis TaxID=2735321 RepID=A0A6M6BDP2_9BACT|nr:MULTISPECIES: hypothetical protein [Hymenobacter]QJX46070.1 hypothetical protein HMJ29_03590 [Hymenobacter taeanensis]UOQ79923.1 hypothetical protein MUN83_13845 [Hymenobacter sp. 5414T-23]